MREKISNLFPLLLQQESVTLVGGGVDYTAARAQLYMNTVFANTQVLRAEAVIASSVRWRQVTESNYSLKVISLFLFSDANFSHEHSGLTDGGNGEERERTREMPQAHQKINSILAHSLV